MGGLRMPLGRSDEPHAALIGEVAVRPLHEHTDAVAESDEIHDVHEQPQQPRNASAEPELSEVGNRSRSTDYREIALVAVAEGNRWPLADQPPDVACGALALLDRGLSDWKGRL